MYCHDGVMYRVSDSIYDEFIRASGKGEVSDPEKLQDLNNRIRSTYKPIRVDYLATSADEAAGLF